MPHRIKRALEYPYPVPEHDYLFSAGEARLLAQNADLSGRTPVLAVGSNRSPEQLSRKFGDGPDVHIPVTRLALHDYDVVFNGYMARYGSIPATILASPGTVVHIYLTWLDDAQLVRMHETESVGINTDFGRIDGVKGRGRVDVTTVWTYQGRRGAFAPDGAPVALKEVHAENRSFTAMGQTEVSRLIHHTHGSGDFHRWLIEHIEDVDKRIALTRKMLDRTVPAADPGFVVTLV